MLSIPAGIRIWLVAGVTDMRRGLDGLSALVQTALSADVLSGQLFIFRGRRADRVKIIWHDADGLCLFYKRLDRGKFVWTQAADGVVLLTPAQLSTLLEGIDWRRVHRSASLEDDSQPPTAVV
jgi:transposase